MSINKALRSQWNVPFFYLATLTYKLDLDILPLDLHAKIQIRTSVRSAGIARRTDRQTNDVKTIRAIKSYNPGGGARGKLKTYIN